MLSFVKARRIAEAWVNIVTDGSATLDRDKTQARPSGWLFYWNSKEYLANPPNEDARLIGNVPIFVDRVNGEVFVAGPVSSNWLVSYEASIPAARLTMAPELPHWDAR
jgi:hypothetical protein